MHRNAIGKSSPLERSRSRFRAFQGHEFERSNQRLRHLAVCRWPFGDFAEIHTPTQHCNSAAGAARPSNKMIKTGMRGKNGEHLQVSSTFHPARMQDDAIQVASCHRMTGEAHSQRDGYLTNPLHDGPEIARKCVFCLFKRRELLTTTWQFPKNSGLHSLLVSCWFCSFSHLRKASIQRLPPAKTRGHLAPEVGRFAAAYDMSELVRV